jgi:hypothetical protein
MPKTAKIPDKPFAHIFLSCTEGIVEIVAYFKDKKKNQPMVQLTGPYGTFLKVNSRNITIWNMPRNVSLRPGFNKIYSDTGYYVEILVPN